ncbi:MAG: hypothetical protein M3512_17025 [Bacteroidota bacterium]|nr:hypothetical protein [Bacteroidota bacterium]
MVKFVTLKFANAITLFPFVLVDKKAKITRRLVQHEKIHLRQQMEMLVIPFYLLYLIEYFINILRFKSTLKAYRNICFERECYENENTRKYLQNRKPYSWVKYL